MKNNISVKIKTAAAAAALILGAAVTANASYDVLVNNYPVKFNSDSGLPEAVGDTVYLPVRRLVESCGGSVGWANGCATVRLRGIETRLWDGQSFAHVNSEQMWLSYPIRISGGRMMISIEDTGAIGLYKDITQPYSGVYLHNKFYGEGDRFFNIVTTFSGDPHTSRAFSWEAQPQYNDMVIEYREKSSDTVMTQRAGYTEKAISFANNTIAGVSSKIYDAEYVSEMENMLFYKTELTGLKPGTAYIYRVGDIRSGEWSEYFEFTTEAEATDTFSVIGVTDPQGRTREEYTSYSRTLYAALTDAPEAAFVINMGDLTDNGNFDDWWKYFFDAANGIKERLPLMTAVGNHENRGDAVKYYNLRFYNPNNAVGLGADYAPTPGDERVRPIIENLDNTVYSFDYGNAHFAIINTGTDWSAARMRPLLERQRSWLMQDLGASEKDWKILLLHIGIYGAKMRENLCRELFESVADEYGADLVLEGHDHTYMRTYQMRGGNKVSDEMMYYKQGEGALYALIGSAAQKRYNSDELYPWMAVQRNIPKEAPSYTIMRFDTAKISVISKLTDGTVIDEFSILKKE